MVDELPKLIPLRRSGCPFLTVSGLVNSILFNVGARLKSRKRWHLLRAFKEGLLSRISYSNLPLTFKVKRFLGLLAGQLKIFCLIR